MKRLFIGLTFLLCLAPALAFAGPWTKSLGQVYAKAGESLYFANGFVDSNGVYQDGTQYFGATTSLYLEAGVWERLHLSAYLPYTFAVNTFDDDWKFMRGSGGDSTFGVQYSPLKSVLWGLRLEAKIPLYDLGSYDGEFPERFPASGDGQLDFSFLTTYGGAFAQRFFYAVDVGYQLRTSSYIGEGPVVPFEYQDTILATGQLGMTIVKPVVSLNLMAAIPTKEDTRTKGSFTTALNAFIPFGQNWAAEAGASYTPWARNSARGVSTTVGFSYRR